ncbi:CAP domain-containing protein [Candidatus Shapirobacteria bacterium]|nr:CAP domain-containing protein [Candidatus Shapirobacteria bacterium]
MKKISKSGTKITASSLSKIFFIFCALDVLFFISLVGWNYPNDVNLDSIFSSILFGVITFIAGLTFLFLSISSNRKSHELKTKDTFKVNSSKDKTPHKFLTILLVLAILFMTALYVRAERLEREKRNIDFKSKTNPTPTLVNRLSETENKIPTKSPEKTIGFIKPKDEEPWGVAKQLDEVTWSMKVGQDERIATAQEIFEALNIYRESYGRGRLVWDEKLAEFARERANYFNSIESTDKHAGFKACTQNKECFSKFGRSSLGENSCYGYKLLGVHLIEWVFAGDEPHNENQLSPGWIYVGIGVDGLGVDIIFGI